MPSREPYARIAITLPQADLATADRLAAVQDRSRSWIIAEALRRYAAAFPSADSPSLLGASRHAQLLRDASLSAEARVHEAEGVTVVGAATPQSLEVPLRFTSFDEFLRWRHAHSDWQ